jgi:acyl carrier protein
MTLEMSDLPADAARTGLPGPVTVEGLTAWLVERVAIYLQRDPEEIDPGEPLAAYGLDSVAALSLCGDVEEDFDLVLDPTAAWDHPTATAFAEHIFEELAAAAGRPR